MKKYEKPVITVIEDLAEGVYAASGDYSSGAAKCDSIYMKGVWEKGDYSSKNVKANLGCNGCPAYTGSGCGLTSHYVESGYASSYDVDNGNRKPSWESSGKSPEDAAW